MKMSDQISKLLPGTIYNIPPISHAFVFKFLSSLKSSKATGLDGISAKYFKMFAPYITDSIVKLCNKDNFLIVGKLLE